MSSDKDASRTHPGSGWKWGAAAGVSAAAVLGGSIAVASIPNGNTINGCRKTSGGALRLVDPAGCGSGEAAVSWTTWKARGSWSSGISYKSGDVVRYFGRTYVSIKAGTGHAPPNSTYWSSAIAAGIGNSTTKTDDAAVGGVDAFLDTSPGATSQPIVTVAAGQKVQINASAVVGATAGASLTYDICYANTSDNILHHVGTGTVGISLSFGKNQTVEQESISLSMITPVLFASGSNKTFEVGLCGTATGGSFNTNGKVVTSAFAF